MREKILAAVYGIYQLNLKEHDLLDKYGAPKKKKDISIHVNDIINVYKWLSEELKSVSEYQLNKYADNFNKLAQKLHDEYLLNMTLLGTYLLLQYIDEYGTKPEQIMVGSKLNRIANHFTFYIERSVYRESRIAADNLFRLYTDRPELTMKIRSKNAERWQEAKRRSYGDNQESD